MATSARPSSKAKTATVTKMPASVPQPRQTRRNKDVILAPPVISAPPPTRKATLMTLLSRPEGAALSELVAATAWQTHSVRAALTHFRLAGFTVNRTRDETGAARYHLVGA